MKQEEIKNKFIIAFDTICDGWQCAKDEDENLSPELFDSEADAMFELFNDALSMITNQSEEELNDNNITSTQRDQMTFISRSGDTDKMKEFLDQNPECNYNDEFIVPAEEFIAGRKAIYTEKGLVITGTKLTDL